MTRPKSHSYSFGDQGIRSHTEDTNGRVCPSTQKKCAGAHKNCLDLKCPWAFEMKGLPMPAMEAPQIFSPVEVQPDAQPVFAQ